MERAELIETIRMQVAQQHNVLLGKDDPILVSVTLNELVISHFIDLAVERIERAQHEVIASSAHQVDAAKETASRLVTEAAEFVAREVRRAATEAADDAGSRVRRAIAEAESVGADANQAKRGANYAAWIAAGAALVALGCMLVIIVVMLGR